MDLPEDFTFAPKVPETPYTHTKDPQVLYYGTLAGSIRVCLSVWSKSRFHEEIFLYSLQQKGRGRRGSNIGTLDKQISNALSSSYVRVCKLTFFDSSLPLFK
jgi:hypothetical protein